MCVVLVLSKYYRKYDYMHTHNYRFVVAVVASIGWYWSHEICCGLVQTRSIER